MNEHDEWDDEEDFFLEFGGTGLGPLIAGLVVVGAGLLVLFLFFWALIQVG